MQTPKTRTGSLEIPQRTSPVTPRAARQLKTTGTESDTATSTHLVTRMDRSSKVTERRSPRSPVSEKKRPSRAAELESQVSHLQDDLKKAKDQLALAESYQKRAQQEADEAKTQVSAMAAKLDDSQHQLLELSASEEARVLELRRLSQERDQAWQTELDAVQKQQSVDSAALVSAMNEIQRLRLQLELVSESEAAQAKHAEAAQAELQALKLDMAQALALVEGMKTQLRECKESEAQAKAMANVTLLDLEKEKTTVEMLRSDGFKAMESLTSVTAELEASKAKVTLLQEVASKLQEDLVQASGRNTRDLELDELAEANGESEKLKIELDSVKAEVEQVRSALETVQIRYQQEQIQSGMQIQSAYESVERMKSELNQREVELVGELDKSKADIVELKANLMDKETELQSISEENEGLKLEMDKRESERSKGNAANSVMLADALAETEAVRAREQEALVKLGCVTVDAEQSSRKAARVAEQLEAVQAANSAMDSELRCLRVQSEQWRKAAEVAAAMLSTANNGGPLDKYGQVDTEYHPVTRKIVSPYADDEDEDSPKKKSNVLKKFGELWKKGPK